MTSAVLLIASAGDGSAGLTISVSWTGASVPRRGVLASVAVFVISVPASRSPWVTSYVAVKVTEAPGASVATVAGVNADNVPVPECISETESVSKATLPVFAMT